MRIQKRVKGGRNALPSCVLKSIHNWVNKESKRFEVSRSFVVATALAHVAGITNQEDYRIPERRSNNGKRK